MKYGIVFPQTEIGNDVDDLHTFFVEIERMGFDYVMIYDHVIGVNRGRLGQGPYDSDTPFHEVFTLFSWAAALTTGLEFALGVLILPQRQTVLAAKQATQIDILSSGRFRLGIGVGWNKLEMQSLGYDFHIRGKRIEEQVDVMRLLWENHEVTFKGDFHDFQQVGINPRPVNRIPVWFGGKADAVLRRMARQGDGWLPNAVSPDAAKPILADLHRYLQENDRNPAEFGIDMRINAGQQPEHEWQPFIASWRELGATHMAIHTMNAGFKHVDDHLKLAQRYIEMNKS